MIIKFFFSFMFTFVIYTILIGYAQVVFLDFTDTNLLQLLKAYRIKFQKFAAHAHKDALINETFIPT